MALPTALPRPQSSPATTRRHELDWLRALAVLGLIPFHAAIIFTTGSGDYIKNGQTSIYMNFLASFISFWGIQLLFFIAGAAAFFALRQRDSRRYINERLSRLAIPFIFGVLTVVPLQIYIGYLATPGAHTSFLQYYTAVYLQQWVGVLHGSIPGNGDAWVGHLWFIPPLLLYSLLALPLFHMSRHLPDQPKQQGIEIFSGWRMLLLFGLPLGLVEFVLHGNGPKSLSLDYLLSENWAEFVCFLLFFLYGYIMYSSSRFTLSARRYAWPAIGLGTACWLVSEGLVQTHLVPANDYSPGYASFMVLRGYVSWFWVIGITGLAMRYLGWSDRLLTYLKQGTYPIYVLHMLVLTFVASFVVRWDADLLAKFLVIVILTVAVTLLLYDLLIKRIGVLRFLFGLAAQQSKRAVGKTPTGHGSRSRTPMEQRPEDGQDYPAQCRVPAS
jgi:glucans biosynthesis protein C